MQVELQYLMVLLKVVLQLSLLVQHHSLMTLIMKVIHTSEYLRVSSVYYVRVVLMVGTSTEKTEQTKIHLY